jgi:hypothetical protein
VRHDQITALPEQLTREAVAAAFEGLGIPVKRLAAAEFAPDGVYLTLYAEDAGGSIYTDGNDHVAQHRIWVPVAREGTP